MNQPKLCYFADPMCSWCWGFTPVIEEIEKAYKDRLKVNFVMGGLRPGTVETMTPQMREEILHHWHAVQDMSGQVFTFEGAMPEGFIYDTEIPSRGVVAVSEMNPDATGLYFKSVQSAFYVDQKDVTKPEVLAQLAVEGGMKADPFLELFHSEAIRNKTREQFRQALEWHVRGFPTVVLQKGEGHELLTHGYRPFHELQPTLDAWLSK